MSPTLEDLFQFMKSDKEERARERGKDKQEIKDLISQGVKTEVQSLLNPMQERVKVVEDTQESMMDQLLGMSNQI